MRNFLSLYLLNVGLAVVTIGVVLLTYLYFPNDGFSAGPVLAIVLALALIAVTTWALWPNGYEWFHVVVGFACGAAAVGIVVLMVSNNGWSTVASATGLVILVLAWIGVVSILNHKVAEGHWFS